MHHRAVTDQALRDARFVGQDLWRYMRRPLPAPKLPHAGAVEATTPEPGHRQLTVRHGDQVTAETTIGVPESGIGVLWWVGVEPTHQCEGLGAGLLGTALDMDAQRPGASVVAETGDVGAEQFVDPWGGEQQGALRGGGSQPGGSGVGVGQRGRAAAVTTSTDTMGAAAPVGDVSTGDGPEVFEEVFAAA